MFYLFFYLFIFLNLQKGLHCTITINFNKCWSGFWAFLIKRGKYIDQASSTVDPGVCYRPVY